MLAVQRGLPPHDVCVKNDSRTLSTDDNFERKHLLLLARDDSRHEALSALGQIQPRVEGRAPKSDLRSAESEHNLSASACC